MLCFDEIINGRGFTSKLLASFFQISNNSQLLLSLIDKKPLRITMYCVHVWNTGS